MAANKATSGGMVSGRLRGARPGKGVTRAGCGRHRSDSRARARTAEEAPRGADRPGPARSLHGRARQARKRPRSIETDQSLINKHILPALGRTEGRRRHSRHVERLHRQISAPRRSPPIGPSPCQKAMSACRSSGRCAHDNPCKGVERNPEERRERYLTPAELGRLCDALNRRQDELEAAASRS